MNGTFSISMVRVLAVGTLLFAAFPGSAQTNRPVVAPPTPPKPMLRSPVDSFRTLLVMPSSERRAQLASRPPEIREKLLAKVQEYLQLTPEERELRLKATELRWYLQPLLKSPATNRAEQLQLVPENLRELVAARISLWDRFPPAVQQIMLTNQVGTDYVVTGIRTNTPPLPMLKIRERLHERYNQLFDLTAVEKEKVLATLSDAERRQMEKTLAAFAQLTPEQRRNCVRSFSRFASMSPDEQQEFLRNVERWSQMTAAERQSWRELVSNAPKIPPLPALTRRLPPLPRHSPPAATHTTNGG